jgi:hypothetical protein
VADLPEGLVRETVAGESLGRVFVQDILIMFASFRDIFGKKEVSYLLHNSSE